MTSNEMAVEDIEERLRADLPRELYEHIARTRVRAVEIAIPCDVDPEKCGLAALLHDCCRHFSDPWLLNLAVEFCIVVSDVERDKPVLLHGPVGAEMARRNFGVTDEEVLDAIRYHTTGRAGMSIVGQVVYLADKTEPGKQAIVSKVRSRSELRSAVLGQVDGLVLRCVKNAHPIHPLSIEMRNWLLEARAED